MARNQQHSATAAPAAGDRTAPGEAAQALPGGQQSLADAQAAAILNAVEQQLTKYFGAMAARAEAVQQASEAGRNELIAHFQQQIDLVRGELDRSAQSQERYERDLQAAIEERLTEFAASQHWRIGEVEGRLERVREELSLGLPGQVEAATTPLQQRLDRTTELLASRIEELQNAARRFDEQSSTLVQHVNDTTSALSRRLDETGRSIAGQLDERTVALSQRVDDAMGGMRQHVADQVSSFGRRLEDTENKIIDRALAMEERINEHTGVRLAGVEATIGRISSGIDDAIVALSHRVIGLENINHDMTVKIDQIAAEMASVDQDAINQLREQMSSAVGESMLVRIELERVASSTGEQFDKFNLRLGELAAEIADSSMDVSTAVQLERLEEIERALVELDPDQFVRKPDQADQPDRAADEITGAMPSADAPTESPVPPATAGGEPSESNLSSW
ncbi:MAG: hypothetical protein ABIW84_07650 [Ilumatobacteraceae bacterium]